MSFLDLTDSAVQRAPGDIPSGTYVAECVISEVQATKSGDGRLLKTKWRVTGGEYKGQSVYCNFNIENKSAQAQEIGRAQLKSAMLASGKGTKLETPNDMVGAVCAIRVGQEKKYDGSMTAAIKGFQSLDAAQPDPTTSGGGFN